MNDTRILALIDDLLVASAETSCVEFKENNFAPSAIGKYISALANAAALAERDFAYLLWGVRDSDHTITGTRFDPDTAKHQGQPLEFWLAQRLNPDVAFRFQVVKHPQGRLVLLEIPAATTSPVEFDRTAYCRIGSAKPRLANHPDHQKVLWSKLQPYLWERGLAAQFLTGEAVLARLDYASYFDRMDQTQPSQPQGILERLSQDQIITLDVGGRWNITNLGAILFAKHLDEFDSRLARKALRFTAYDGTDRTATVTHRHDEPSGYAVGFAKIVEYIDRLLPRNEQIDQVVRIEQPLFPSIALRELIANALIHQDMTITGAGPSIELFSNRLEITNPGKPLINPNRFIDSPPRSRNEALAAFMRRMKFCEEQGTGIDKVVAAVELYQLPPPDFRAQEDGIEAMCVVLFAPRRFAAMTVEERVRACYQHAVLKFVNGEQMKNNSLRARLGIDRRNAAQVSQVIRRARDRQLIKAADPERPQSGYVPFWA